MGGLDRSSARYLKEGGLNKDLLEEGKQAEKAMSGMDYEGAINHYDKILARRPDLDEVWAYKGIALSFLQRNEEAWFCLSKALEIRPDEGGNWDARQEFALNLKNTDYFRKHVEDYLKYHNEETKSILLHANAAIYFMKDYDFAIELCNRYLRIRPDDKHAKRLIEKALKKKSGKGWW